MKISLCDIPKNVKDILQKYENEDFYTDLYVRIDLLFMDIRILKSKINMNKIEYAKNTEEYLSQIQVICQEKGLDKKLIDILDEKFYSLNL